MKASRSKTAIRAQPRRFCFAMGVGGNFLLALLPYAANLAEKLTTKAARSVQELLRLAILAGRCG